jgi:hypothetical protein
MIRGPPFPAQRDSHEADQVDGRMSAATRRIPTLALCFSYDQTRAAGFEDGTRAVATLGNLRLQASHRRPPSCVVDRRDTVELTEAGERAWLLRPGRQ